MTAASSSIPRPQVRRHRLLQGLLLECGERGQQIKARSPFLGATVASLSPALADELRLDSQTEGVAITDVADGSTAQSLGFQKGDVVLSVNNEKIAKPADLARVAGAGGRQWRITIMRGGQQISVVFSG